MTSEALPLTGDAEADAGHAQDEANGYSRIVPACLAEKGYTLEKLLGLGSRSRVYLATNRTGSSVALRVQARFSQWRPREKPTFWNRTLLKLLPTAIPRHPNLVRYLDTGTIRCNTWTDEKSSRLMFAAMSCIDGISVESALKERLFQSRGPQFMIQTLRGVLAGWSALHQRGLRQGDIHPGNILLEITTQNPVLIDLRVSIRYGRALKHERRRFRALVRALLTGVWRNEHEFPALNPDEAFANWNGRSIGLDKLLQFETQLGSSLQRASPPKILVELDQLSM